MASDQDIQKIAMEMEYCQNQAEEIQAQIRTLNALVQENDSAKEALQNLSEKNESLFAIGSGVFVKAKPSSNKVLVEIGAKVLAEKNFGDAAKSLDERRERLAAALSKMQEALGQLSARMQALNEKAEELQQR